MLDPAVSGLLSHAPFVVFQWEPDSRRRVRAVTTNVSHTFGYAAEDFDAHNLDYAGLAHAEDRERVDAGLRGLVEEDLERVRLDDYRIGRPDGSYRWVQDTTVVQRDGAGGVDHWLGYVLDITERKLTELGLRERSDQLDAARRPAKLSYWRWSLEKRRLTACCEFCREILGVSPDRMPSTYEELIELVHPDDRDRVLREHDVSAAECRDYSLEYRIVRGDGELRVVREVGQIEREKSGSAVAHVGTLQDITDLKIMEADLRYQATHDPLTRLPNRALFLDRLSLAIAGARRNRTLAGLLFIDLDEFKSVNDEAGHDVGDRVLETLGERLYGCVRATDTPSRYGGDEFTVVMTDLRNEAAVETVATKIGEALSKPYRVGARTIDLNCSIGIALYPNHGSTSEALIKAADTAMYDVKRAGKDGHSFASGR